MAPHSVSASPLWFHSHLVLQRLVDTLPTFASPLFYSIPSLISLSLLSPCLLRVLVFLMSFLDFVIKRPKTAGGKNRTYKIIWAQTRMSAKALSSQTISLCVTAAPSCFCLPLSSFCHLVCYPSFFLLLIHLLLCILYFLCPQVHPTILHFCFTSC